MKNGILKAKCKHLEEHVCVPTHCSIHHCPHICVQYGATLCCQHIQRQMMFFVSTVTVRSPERARMRRKYLDLRQVPQPVAMWVFDGPGNARTVKNACDGGFVTWKSHHACNTFTSGDVLSDSGKNSGFDTQTQVIRRFRKTSFKYLPVKRL